MASTFTLRLVTPTGIVFEGEVDQVNAFGPLGEFGVLPEHINFITSLAPGIAEIKMVGGDVLRYVISGGFAEVKDGEMTLLADGAESPESLNRAQVDEELTAAEATVSAMNSYDPAYVDASSALMLARARREATELKSRA
ncbi:MAG TPA: ATP synthase F1 subunit epsilon [Candidatus Binataceae bacterium]|nr:ATP synthase F1 subunit epsilon [Candidatus Binataceae bacterium]